MERRKQGTEDRNKRDRTAEGKGPKGEWGLISGIKSEALTLLMVKFRGGTILVLQNGGLLLLDCDLCCKIRTVICILEQYFEERRI